MAEVVLGGKDGRRVTRGAAKFSIIGAFKILTDGLADRDLASVTFLKSASSTINANPRNAATTISFTGCSETLHVSLKA